MLISDWEFGKMDNLQQSEKIKTQNTNRFGQPIGKALPDWKTAQYPKKETIEGRYCKLEPLELTLHAEALYSANCRIEKEECGLIFLTVLLKLFQNIKNG